MIGHAKNDGRLGRNYLLGTGDDKINARLATADHNLRLVLVRQARLLVRFIDAFSALMTKLGQMSIASDPEPLFLNIELRLSGQKTSRA
jgi:hypothetical protein